MCLNYCCGVAVSSRDDGGVCARLTVDFNNEPEL